MIKVLFVCLGNICRSPMAEGMFKSKVEAAGLSDNILSDSCGTGAYHIGEQPDPRTLKTLKNHGIAFRHAARQLQVADGVEFDYILAMDDSNLFDIRHKLKDPSANISLMRAFDEMDRNGNVPDPYFGGADGFEHVFEILDRSLDQLLETIRKEHHL